jgi:hypothetical protein
MQEKDVAHFYFRFMKLLGEIVRVMLRRYTLEL